MKRILFSSLLVIAVLGLGASAEAQQKDKKPPPKTDTSQPGQRVKNYDFDADLVEGELVRPSGEFLNTRVFAEHGSLIRVRTDFIREIVKSAEDL